MMKFWRTEPVALLAIFLYVGSLLVLLISHTYKPACEWYPDESTKCGYRLGLEALYFICGGPLLLLVAAFGMRQVRMGKEALEVSKLANQQVKQIESARFASDLAKYFIDDVLPRLAKALDTWPMARSAIVSRMSGKGANITWYGYSTLAEVEEDKEVIKLLAHMQHSLNQLDLFASMVKVYPEQEEQLYSLCAGAFLHSVAGGTPLLSLPKTKDKFDNLRTLIRRWGDVQATKTWTTTIGNVPETVKPTFICKVSIEFTNKWPGHPDVSF